MDLSDDRTGISTGMLSQSIGNDDDNLITKPPCGLMRAPSPIVATVSFNPDDDVAAVANQHLSTPPKRGMFYSTPFASATYTSSPDLVHTVENCSSSSQQQQIDFRNSPKSDFRNSPRTRHSNARYKDLQAQLIGSESKVDALEREKQRLQSEIVQLQRYIHTKEEYQKQLLEDAERIEEREREHLLTKENLQNVLTDLQRKYQELQAENSTLQRDADIAIAKIERLESENRALKSKLDRSQETVQALEVEQQGASSVLSSLEKEVVSMKEEQLRMRSMYQDTRDCLISAERERDSLRQQVESLKAASIESAASASTSKQEQFNEFAVVAETMQWMEALQQKPQQQEPTVNLDIVKTIRDMLDEKFSSMQTMMANQPAPASQVPSACEIVSIDTQSERGKSSSPVFEAESEMAAPSEGAMIRPSSLAPSSTSINSLSIAPSTTIDEILPETVMEYVDTMTADYNNFEQADHDMDMAAVRKLGIAGNSARRRMRSDFSSQEAPSHLTASSTMSSRRREIITQSPRTRNRELAGRNRCQPRHLQSAYAIEEASFFASENDLRHGRNAGGYSTATMPPQMQLRAAQSGDIIALDSSNSNVLARPVSCYVVSSNGDIPTATPTVSSVSKIPQPTDRPSITAVVEVTPTAQSRVMPTAPVSIVVSKPLASAAEPKAVDNSIFAKPFSIPNKPLTMEFSPPTRGRKAVDDTANNAEKENVKRNKDLVMMFSPPKRQPQTKSKAVDTEVTPTASSKGIFSGFFLVSGRKFGFGSKQNTPPASKPPSSSAKAAITSKQQLKTEV